MPALRNPLYPAKTGTYGGAGARPVHNSPMAAPSDLLAALAAIVSEAGQLAQQERARMVSELKPDGTVVTNADREVETFLRRRLPELVPGTGVWGEEFD